MPLVPLALERHGPRQAHHRHRRRRLGRRHAGHRLAHPAARGALGRGAVHRRRRGRGLGDHRRLHADRQRRDLVHPDLAARRHGRRALGGERDLDERGRRGEAPRPGHGGLFHAGGARPGAGAVRAADRRRLRTQAVHHLCRPGAAGGAAAAALLEDGAEDRACRGQRLPAGRRPGAARHAGGFRLRAGRAGRLQLPAGLCRRRRRDGRDRRALALDLRHRQRGPAMADRLDGRSFRPAPGAGGLRAREHPAGHAAVGRLGAVADGHRRDRAVGRAVVCDLSRWPGAARPAHRRRRHRARQHRLQHALHPGRPGRPAARGCGDGCGRRSRARLDARGLLFDRRAFAPCWHSTDAADKAAAA